MTRIFYASVNCLLDEKNFIAAKNILPDFRKEKAESLKCQKDKALSVGAWLVLQAALDGFPLYDGTEVIEKEKNGKLYFKNNPHVHFCISHSGNVCLCAVSDKQVGADVQLVCDYNEKICKKYFFKSETDFVQSGKDIAEKKDRFFKVWTNKEAYCKMTGLGIGGFKETPTDRNIFGVSTFEFEIPGYKAAVCVNGSNEEFVFHEINLLNLL